MGSQKDLFLDHSYSSCILIIHVLLLYPSTVQYFKLTIPFYFSHNHFFCPDVQSWLWFTLIYLSLSQRNIFILVSSKYRKYCVSNTFVFILNIYCIYTYFLCTCYCTEPSCAIPHSAFSKLFSSRCPRSSVCVWVKIKLRNKNWVFLLVSVHVPCQLS